MSVMPNSMQLLVNQDLSWFLLTWSSPSKECAWIIRDPVITAANDNCLIQPYVRILDNQTFTKSNLVQISHSILTITSFLIILKETYLLSFSIYNCALAQCKLNQFS